MKKISLKSEDFMEICNGVDYLDQVKINYRIYKAFGDVIYLFKILMRNYKIQQKNIQLLKENF